MKVYLTHLYPKQMSIYGDYGNILAMQFFLKGLGVEYEYQTVDINQDLPQNTDFYFLGGGQDKEQSIIFQDLLAKKANLGQNLENNVPMLAICGGYQLLGQEFLTGTGDLIPGLEILPVITKAPNSSVKSRCVGNLIVNCQIPELLGTKLVGFENHSGQTYFTDQSKAKPLGSVLVGYGNNAFEKIEGCVYKNVIGTYLHGSCLPKNPELTAWFIKKIFQNKKAAINYSDLEKIDSKIASLAKQVILKKFD